MIVLLILILEVVTIVQGGCPIRCTCTQNSITCVQSSLEYVPYFESLDNNPVIIDLSGNPITLIDIDDFSFDKSDQVKEIYLNSTSLSIIDDHAFDELENLQELYLSDNLLHYFPEEIIRSNENMVLLDLSSNYFAEMPKIQSKSLEVLAIANSRIERIGDDALDALPNLRILLLQQNNLKSVNPVIFSGMNNLFFVGLAHNPWLCDCKTVELFEFLISKRFVDVTEPVRCQNEKKIFVELGGKCADFNVTKPSNEIIVTTEFDNDFYYALMLFVAIITSLVLGATCGTCITYKFLTRSVKMSESKNALLYDLRV
ncbi:slit homolog 1 protein [Tribolium castaneum]|uniref:Protein slit-like Protein n=1 Tax=Tribolium castaneum TaxID=7070 RepID=D2A1S4_TRICA|nr:PREDICTED: slit homolog 1 protein [Tribolium castaneum]EFA02096.1 Protein slit-like Protein [Tribolium castaneum]|eukprot:XP_008191569.1 PREDICTED: slit homolog 1 protein [Tribolium castaneum]